MKSLLTLSLGLVASMAVAATAVKIGTAVGYKVTVDQNGQKNDGTMSLEILDHNTTENKYQVRGIVKFNGTTQQNDNWMEAQGVTGGDDLLANCTKNGGTPQEIQVPAGKYKTCLMVEEDKSADYAGQFWVSDVPFVVVKSIETQNGETVTMELSSVK